MVANQVVVYISGCSTLVFVSKANRAVQCHVNVAYRGVRGGFYPLLTNVLQPDGMV